jgi:23S rRNA (cytidine1920-2'-O)/16S rRNA (cytidine1409-2'-O)-methyltransferase
MQTANERRRLDAELVARGLAQTRTQAQALISGGLIEVDGARARTAAQVVNAGAALRVLGREHPWVSRGGVKLDAALEAFDISCMGRVALDAGASTGGFTDVLLARGARLVYAVDVGEGLLDPRLRSDPRVVVMEGTNARHLSALPGPAPDLVTLDLAFISVRLVLPAVAALVARPCDCIVLFKPQFELGRDAIARGGVVRDESRTREGIDAFVDWAATSLDAVAPASSPAAIRGAKGNQEWVLHLRLPAATRAET